MEYLCLLILKISKLVLMVAVVNECVTEIVVLTQTKPIQPDMSTTMFSHFVFALQSLQMHPPFFFINIVDFSLFP